METCDCHIMRMDDRSEVTTEEPIYDETGTKLHMKNAVEMIREKYESLQHLRSPAETASLASEGSSSQADEISDQELLQVEMFFQSHKTTVYVCPSLANLYIRDPVSCNEDDEEEQLWRLSTTGIPVLLLDAGNTRARSQRRIQIILSERGTGFMLWRDVIDNLSNYSSPAPSFHTFYLSSDHRCVVGLSFDDADAAKQMLDKVELLTSDPANISLSGPSSKLLKKNKKKKIERTKLPKKADISQPCCFQHVTSVDVGDKSHLYSLSTYTKHRNSSV